MPARPHPQGPSAASRRRAGRGLAVVVAVALVAVSCSSETGREVRGDADHADPPGAAATTAAAASLWAFTADLGRAVADREPLTNIVLAPVPVALGLAEAWSGATGTTADQLAAALHAGATYDAGLDGVWRDLPDRSGDRQDDTTGRRGRVSLELASSLWAQRNTRFGPPWLDTLASTWDAGIRVTDFRSDPETARQAVNAWVSEQTSGHISQLLQRGSIDQFTRFLATSAAYLRAPLETPFAPVDTRLAPFTRLDGSEVTVPLMARREPDARLARGDGWEAVELPYLGGELTLTVLVPDAGRFDEVADGLDGRALQGVRDAMRPVAVDLSLPQFGVTSQLRLDDALRAIGVTDAFDRGVADFSGITTDEPLTLAGVVHETYLSLDEEGTEASATRPRPSSTTTRGTATTALPGTALPDTALPGTALPDTALPGTALPAPSTPTTEPEVTARVVVDRPFLALVTDRLTGAPVLYARVLSPRG